MKRKILLTALFVLIISTLATVSASQDMTENKTNETDELLALSENSETLQATQNNDTEILTASPGMDNLSMKATDNPEETEVLESSVPKYISNYDIWYQDKDLNIEDSNLWIINEKGGGKAFPKDSYIKIVANEKGSNYKAQDKLPVSDIFAERGYENIHYYILLREYTKIQFQPKKTYNLKFYFVSSTGKAKLIAKKTVKLKWKRHKYDFTTIGNYYMYYKYKKNNPYGNFKLHTFKTHPYNKEKIQVIIYKKNGKFAANKKFKYDINGKILTAKTNKRGLLVIPTPEKTGKYTIRVYASNRMHLVFKVKVTHTVKMPKVTVKKSSKKLVIPLELRKSDGNYLKNKKVTFKFDNKTYNVKTNKKGVAKVTIKKPVLRNLKVGEKVVLEAIYKKDTVKKAFTVKK